MRNLLFCILFVAASGVWAQQAWSLKDCVDYAADKNLTVTQSRITQELLENDLEYSKNQWLPNVNGYFDNSLTIGTHHPTIDKGYQQYSNSLGVGSSITLWQGGLLNLNKERSALSLEAGKFSTQKVIDDISLMVVNYYLNVMLNRELLHIAEGNLEITTQQLDRTIKLYEAGSIAMADRVKAEADLAQNKKEVADARIEVDRALFNLALLLQLPDYRDFDVEEVLIPDAIGMKLYDLEEVIRIAFSQQPAIKQAEVELEGAAKDIEIARTGLKPQITGTYNLGTNYADYFNKGLHTDAWLKQWWNNLTNVFGVSLNVPIFEKHNTRLNVQKQQINENMAMNNMEQQKQTIRQNVQDAYFNANSASESFEAAKENVRANEVSFDFAQKSFDAGVLNIYDLNIAQNNLMTAKAQMAHSKYNFVFRMKVLDFYAGIPLDEGL